MHIGLLVDHDIAIVRSLVKCKLSTKLAEKGKSLGNGLRGIIFWHATHLLLDDLHLPKQAETRTLGLKALSDFAKQGGSFPAQQPPPTTQRTDRHKQ